MKLSVISGVIVLALGGYFGYHIAYVRPLDSIEQIHQQLEEARQTQTLRTHVASAIITLEEPRQRLALRPDSTWLLQEVGKLAEEAGIQVASMTPRPPQPRGEATFLSVLLQFTASFHELGQFLNRIESHERFIRVDRVEVTPQAGASGKAQMQVALSALYLSSLHPTALTAAGAEPASPSEEGMTQQPGPHEAAPTGAAEPDVAPSPSTARYTATSSRDPLLSVLPTDAPEALRQQSALEAARLPSPLAPSDLSIEGLIWDGPRPQAVIGGEVYDVGDTVQGATIVSIDHTGVVGTFQGATIRWVIDSGARSPRPIEPGVWH